MATDFDRGAFKASHDIGGAAMRRMQELAQAIYDSTPGIQDELPRHTSKILANVKKEDNRAEKRAQTFIAEGSALRKGGSLEKKDLTVAMSAEDWETKYKEIWEKFMDEKKRTEVLKDRLVSKQERYIGREQEYRKTIENIEKQIEDHSTKPLQIIQSHDENQLLMMGVDPSQPEAQAMIEKERKQKLKNEIHMNQKNVKEIHSAYDKIMETIGLIQDNTAKELWKQRSEIWTTLDKKLEEIKFQLKAETDKKKENQYDFKEKEKELNEHLETMTQIAQKIDDENRDLMKKNGELKIQYLSQENDRDLLLKQLIYQKKESQRLKKMLEDKKKEAEDAKALDDMTLKSDVSRSNLYSRGGGGARLKSGFASKPQYQNVNTSGLTNSRRNISLGTSAMYMGVGNRPKTAAMGGGGLPRPPTAVNKQGFGNKVGGGVIGGQTLPSAFMAQRAVSANIPNHPKLKRYEDLISRLKKMIQVEKQSLRMVRTMCAKEIESKNQLEKIMRQCVDDVKAEIAKKRSENKSIYYAKGRKGQGDLMDDKNLTQQEREKIIEVLLSQERVLTLLYDKTFPPRPATAKVALKSNFGTTSAMAGHDEMRQFNYYGNIPEEEEIEAADIDKLEREIADVLKNRANGDQSENTQSGIVNISSKGGQYGNRHKSAGPGKRVKGGKHQAYDEAADVGDDIYEDEESSSDSDM